MQWEKHLRQFARKVPFAAASSSLFPLCSTHFALMGVQEGSEKVLSSFSILNVTQPHLHRYRHTLIMCPFRRSVDNKYRRLN